MPHRRYSPGKLLPEEKAALKSILEGVVSEKLGIKVSSEEVAKINDLSKKIDTAQQKLGEDFGNPAKTQENIDFMLSLKDMTDFIISVIRAFRSLRK